MKSKRHLVVALEHRFFSHASGLYSRLAFPYEYWKDYLTYFDSVELLARVQAVERVEEGMKRVDGERVGYLPVPYYVGMRGFLKGLPLMLATLWKVALRRRYFLLRSGNVTNVLWLMLILLRRPYIREYPGNVQEGILGVAGRSFLIKFVANVSQKLAVVQGRFSRANSFVSNNCKSIYSSKRPSFVFSSFQLDEVERLRPQERASVGSFTLVSVGRVEGEKGHGVLIESLKDQRLEAVTLNLIGNGRLLDKLKAKAADERVVFYGAITDRQRLFDILCSSDLFVIPSFTEGMPRALLEAMALGMPCIGSRVGGLPEVLPDECMFPPGDCTAISNLIAELMVNPERRQVMGHRNREFVKINYSREDLEKRKHEFWSMVYE